MMDTVNRVGLIILCVLALGACATDPVGKAPAAATDTTALYQQTCARCHGGRGGGKFGLLMKLTEVDLTDEQIRVLIRTGRGRMPAFDELSDTQTMALARLVRSFQSPAKPTRPNVLVTRQGAGKQGHSDDSY